MSEGIKSQIYKVPGEWIDYNGHMNLAYYVMAFDQSLDLFLDQEIGVGESLVISRKQGPFVLQNHVHYLDELLVDEQYYCRFLLLDGDAKRLHIAGSMHRADNDVTVCVMEQVLINVDHDTRRSTPYPIDIQTRITALVKVHARIPRPSQIGRPIGLTC